MRRLILLAGLFCILGAAVSATAHAAQSRVIKVLPFFLDTNGVHSLSPSLYERDAYQAFLRWHPENRGGLRVDVEWHVNREATQPKLRLELRGVAHAGAPALVTLEAPIKGGGWFEHWTTFKPSPAQYQALGEITAWHATLWDGDKLLGEQKSFLW